MWRFPYFLVRLNWLTDWLHDYNWACRCSLAVKPAYNGLLFRRFSDWLKIRGIFIFSSEKRGDKKAIPDKKTSPWKKWGQLFFTHFLLKISKSAWKKSSLFFSRNSLTNDLSKIDMGCGQIVVEEILHGEGEVDVVDVFHGHDVDLLTHLTRLERATRPDRLCKKEQNCLISTASPMGHFVHLQ